MPSKVKSSGCCIGRHPPSPDGLAPRPANSSVSSGRRVSKEHIPSLTTSDVAQLRAIFEEDTITPLPEESSQVKPHKGKGKTTSILEGGKSDSDIEVKVVDVKSKKSSSTLKSVAKRLKKHLSKDSELSKRHSRSSVGTSEEEIERRAELRRIRERRIREELSNEGVYDPDAKSVSSMVDAQTPSERKVPNYWAAGGYIPLPSLTPPALSYPTLPFPSLSPFEKGNDPLEKYMKSLQDENGANHALASSDSLVNSTGTLSRRHSSPVLPAPNNGEPEPRAYIQSRKRSSLLPMCASPLLEPTRLPSITEPGQSSWRLSFASDHRGEHLRKLSQGHAVPITLSVEKLSDTAQPARYLHDKGLRTSSQAITASEENSNLESFASHSQTCLASQDFGGVDGVGDGCKAIHLHEMGISQRLASRFQSSSSPQLSSWGSHERSFSSNGGASKLMRAERARYMQKTSDSIPLSERVPSSWGQVIHGSTSSVYHSASNSLQPSRESSRFNISSFLLGKVEVEVEESEDTETSHMMGALKNISTGDISSSSLAPPLARYARRPTMDDSSVIVSETDSFHRMEAELSVVETRFASSEARRTPSTPVSSKFREEFDFEPPTAEATQSRKKSAFSKLAKLAIRNYDGAQNMEELLNVPVPDFEPDILRSPGAGPLSPLDDDATGLWGKAIKKKRESKAKEVGDQLHIPRKRSSQGRKKSAVEEDKPKGAFEGLINMRKGKKKADINDHKSAAEEYQKRFEERVAVKELVMDSWEAEMEATAAKAKAKSRNIVKKSKPNLPDHRYPASWSRFPSHDRSERLSSAAAVDRVDIKDFAKLGKKDGEIVWCLAHEDDGHHTELEYLKRKKGILDKVKERIDHEVYRTDTQVQQASSSKGRGGSLSMAGELEYPELEVLPLSMTTAEQNPEEPEKEFQGREKKLKRMRANIDGTVDLEAGEERNESIISIADPKFYEDCLVNLKAREAVNDSNVSIADPKFYEDCLVDPLEDGDADMLEEMLPKIGSKKDKPRTWGGRDWEGYKSERRNRNMSLGSVFLRRSTDDHCLDLEVLEDVEKERVLKAADDAWGRRKHVSMVL